MNTPDLPGACRRAPPILATLGLLVACGGGPSAPDVSAQVIAGGWDADERVTVTDFQRATALARSPDRLFIATDGGLAVLSDAFGRWELPITREDGYPESQVLALAWDARDATLWMATREGRLLQFDVTGRRWRDSYSLSAPADRIIAPAGDPARVFLRRGSRWVALDPFSRNVESVDPAEVRTAVERDFDLRARSELLSDPRWDAERAFLGRRGSQRYEITDVMPSAGVPGDFWIATYGGFIERYERVAGGSEVVEYGIIGLGASAVLVDGGGGDREERVWFAPRHASDRYGVASADPALEDWTSWAGSAGDFAHRDAPDAPVRAWLATDAGIWAGGDRGLHLYDGERWSREATGARSDLPPITSLAAGPSGLEGVWVGTERGLLRVPAAGSPPDVLLLNTARVRAIAPHDGALWIGTDAGLVRLRGGAAVDGGVGPPEAGMGPGPRGRVGALASDRHRLVAGIEREVWVRDDGAEWRRPPPLGVLGAPVTALALSDGVVWIGTNEELVAWETATDRLTTFTFAAGDLPAGARGERAIFDLAVESDGAVWAATPAGAVRLDTDR